MNPRASGAVHKLPFWTCGEDSLQSLPQSLNLLRAGRLQLSFTHRLLPSSFKSKPNFSKPQCLHFLRFTVVELLLGLSFSPKPKHERHERPKHSSNKKRGESRPIEPKGYGMKRYPFNVDGCTVFTISYSSTSFCPT